MKYLVASIILILIGATLFGVRASDVNMGMRDFLEALVLWVVPVMSVALLLRSSAPRYVRVLVVVLLVAAYGVAEYIGIQTRQLPAGATIAREHLYAYATLYLIVGPVHALLFLPIAFMRSASATKGVTITVSILLVIVSFFFVWTFADEWPWIISTKLTSIIASEVLLLGSYLYLLHRWLSWKQSAILGIVALIAGVIPSLS